MPLYEYECSACGHHFEVIRKFSDPPEEKCPKCGGAVHKLQSAPAFQFKGTGWYVTDYAKSGQPESKGSTDGKKEKDTATETSSKSDKSDSSSTGSSTSTASPSSPAGTGTSSSKSGD